MSMSDKLADNLTRIRNAQSAGHENVLLQGSKLVEDVVKLLKEEGYIGGYNVSQDGPKKSLKVELKYYLEKPVIIGIEKVSKPGRRVYLKWKDITPTLNNMGTSIISTPKGILTGKEAKNQGVGGEYLCKIW